MELEVRYKKTPHNLAINIDILSVIDLLGQKKQKADENKNSEEAFDKKVSFAKKILKAFFEEMAKKNIIDRSRYTENSNSMTISYIEEKGMKRLGENINRYLKTYDAAIKSLKAMRRTGYGRDLR